MIQKHSVVTTVVRRFATKPVTNGEIMPKIVNRNPRNLERLRLDMKPSGYGLDQVNVEFWHKLQVIAHNRFISAQVIHNTKKVVVEASTNEIGFEKELYSLKDKQAYVALATIFAERCFESGIYCVTCDTKITEENTNMNAFLNTVKNEGLMLEEPPVYQPYHIWHKPREKKPWTVLED